MAGPDHNRVPDEGGGKDDSREAIQQKKFWLEFRLEKRLEIPF